MRVRRTVFSNYVYFRERFLFFFFFYTLFDTFYPIIEINRVVKAAISWQWIIVTTRFHFAENHVANVVPLREEDAIKSIRHFSNASESVWKGIRTVRGLPPLKNSENLHRLQTNAKHERAFEIWWHSRRGSPSISFHVCEINPRTRCSRILSRKSFRVLSGNRLTFLEKERERET